MLNHWGDIWDNYQVDYIIQTMCSCRLFRRSLVRMAALMPGSNSMASEGSATALLGSGEDSGLAGVGLAGRGSAGRASGLGPVCRQRCLPRQPEVRRPRQGALFIETITSGQPNNEIASGVDTALSCMLGRMAGYQKREVTWDELMAHGETYELGMDLKQFA